MRRLTLILLILLTLVGISARAQGDGLNLPAALYVLLNEGRVDRYGVGAVGVATVTPEESFVVDFGVAPDGRWAAFRDNDGLHLLDMADPGFDPVRIEAADRADFPPFRRGGRTLAWSPSGMSLAYTTEYGARVAFDIRTRERRFADIATMPLLHLMWSPEGAYLAAEAPDNIWWIYRRDGFNMVLAGALPSSVGAAWLDNTRLIFAPDTGGLYLVDFAAQNEQTELQPPPRLFRQPARRADGEIAVFTRLIQETNIDENAAYLRRLALEGDAVSVIETSTEPINLSGTQWTPDGGLLMRLGEEGVALVDPATGDNFTLPIPNVVGLSWGVVDTFDDGLATGRDSFFIADDVLGVAQVWRLPGDGSPPQPLTDFDADVTAYAISRDGRRIAFVSDGALWVLDYTEGSPPRALSDIAASTADLTFGAERDELFYADASGIWRHRVDSDERGLLLANADGVIYETPRYALNVNAVLINVRGESDEFAFYDPASEALLMIGAYDSAAWISDGRIIAWNNNPFGAQVALINPTIEPPDVTLLADLEGENVYDVQQVDMVNFRLILGAVDVVGPSRMRTAELAITGGAAITLDVFAALIEPQLSPDGELVIGASGFNRLLRVAQSGQTLRQPTQTRDFRWSP